MTPKFKAFYRKEICEVIAINFDMNTVVVKSKHSSTVTMDGKQHYSQVITDLDKVELLQYTGLEDVNGKDVYEKYIVEYLDGEYSFRAVVERDYHAWYLKAFAPIENLDIDDYSDRGKTDLRVIGNAFEHSHLLEQSE